MITAKLIEIRDRGTFIPALAIRLGADTPVGHYLLGRAGFGYGEDRDYVYLVHLEAQRAHHDAYEWGNDGTRTMQEAHLWLLDHFDEIEEGAVVDVEYILGETWEPKKPEALS